MTPIRTVTLNPCFDLHYSVPDFAAGKVNFVTEAVIEAGGKGVNTSRALAAAGVENLAYLVVGAENAAPYLAQLKADGLSVRVFETPGRIRENLTVHPAAGSETRILLNTFSVSVEAMTRLEETLLAEAVPGMLLSFSGRLPNGVTKERAIALLHRLIGAGVRVAVDSVSFSPEDLAIIHPWFIKPNEEETAALLGAAPASREDAADAARRLVQNGVSETVMISLGGDGAAFSDGDAAFTLTVPNSDLIVSTVGAGDSTVAGLFAGIAAGLPVEETLRLACAYGHAACLTPGSRPPRPADVRSAFPAVTLRTL